MTSPSFTKKDIFYEKGHALCWIEFREKGCPLTKEDAERDYFLSEDEVLRIAEKIKRRRQNDKRRTTEQENRKSS